MNPRRSVIWLALAVLAILAAVCVLAGGSQIGNLMSAGSNDYAGPPAPLALVIAAVCLFCLVLSVYAAIQVAHKLHRQGWDYDLRAPADGRRWGRRGGRGRGRSLDEPIIISFGLLTYLIVVAGFAVWAVNVHAEGALSSYVQHDGMHRTGGILRVQNVEHQDTNDGPYYSSFITVSLAPPMDGHSTTVVHVPHGSSFVVGEGLEILVDPQQPGYAELPGQPFVQNRQWIVAGSFSLAIAVVGFLPMVLMTVRMVARYRRRGTLTGKHTQRALHGR
jgi:hypothetical protein